MIYLSASHPTRLSLSRRTYLGGIPRSVSGFDWPSAEMTFLAQLELAEIQAVETVPWLPATGRLHLFWNTVEKPGGFAPEDREHWFVHYEAEDSAESLWTWPQIWPDDTADPDMVEEIDDFGFDVELSVTPPDDRVAKIGGEAEPLGAPDGDPPIVIARLAASGFDCGGDYSPDEPEPARILGLEHSWRLLLELDNRLDYEWGEFQRLHVFVEADRARAGDFSNVWIVHSFADD